MVTALPADLSTPCLVIDEAVLEANLRATATSAADRGFALRPHAKTHKCIEIAHRQLDLGAVGLTVATIGEAEVFAAAGCTDLFIGYPVWAAGAKAQRLRSLADLCTLSVGVDSPDGAELVGRALSGTANRCFIEIDSGHHRSGVRPIDVVPVAAAAARAGLTVAGVFTFPGHGYEPHRQAAAADDEARTLATAADALHDAGFNAAVRSGGSTPTAALTDATITEIRPGVYVFNDAQQVELGTADWPAVALTAAATVVSRSGNTIIVDAGSKTLGADRAPWATGWGRLLEMPDARIVAISEHHATITIPADEPVPELGAIVRVVPNHVCAAVNLADELVVVRYDDSTDGCGAAVVDRWLVAARGKNG